MIVIDLEVVIVALSSIGGLVLSISKNLVRAIYDDVVRACTFDKLRIATNNPVPGEVRCCA